MENLKYGLFDLFVYALPGAFLIFSSVYIIQFDPGHPMTMIDPNFFEKESHLLSVIIFIVCAYVTGFVMYTLANYLLKLIEVITREFARENQKSIELWNVMKNFSAAIALCRSMEYHRWVKSDLDNAYNKFKDKT